MDTTDEIKLLIKARFPIVCVQTWDEQRVEERLARVAADLRITFWVWSLNKGLRRREQESGTMSVGYSKQDPRQAIEHIATLTVDGIYLFEDLQHYWQDPTVLRSMKDVANVFREDRRTLAMVGSEFDVPADLEKWVARVDMGLPDEDELFQLLRSCITQFRRQGNLEVAISKSQGRILAKNLKGLTLVEAERALWQAMQDHRLDETDLVGVLESKRKMVERSGLLEYFPHKEDLERVGGLSRLKEWLATRGKSFHDADQARAFGLEPPRGVLLLGVQGCGKSLCAKAVATEWQLPLLRLDPGQLYGKYIGESEHNLFKALQLAESVAPCVLWVDELEKAFAGGGSSDADGGTSMRILGAWLNWLQEKPAEVFVVATSNDITALPPELVRKGRFDEIFFVDLPTHDARKTIFHIHLSKRNRNPEDFDLEELALLTEGFSGAEIEQAVVSALYAAFSGEGVITTDLIEAEIRKTRPLSVVMAERIHGLRAWADGRTVPAD